MQDVFCHFNENVFSVHGRCFFVYTIGVRYEL